MVFMEAFTGKVGHRKDKAPECHAWRRPKSIWGKRPQSLNAIGA
jgi:hypothetical protein